MTRNWGDILHWHHTCTHTSSVHWWRLLYKHNLMKFVSPRGGALSRFLPVNPIFLLVRIYYIVHLPLIRGVTRRTACCLIICARSYTLCEQAQPLCIGNVALEVLLPSPQPIFHLQTRRTYGPNACTRWYRPLPVYLPPVLSFPPPLSSPTLRVKFTQLTAVLRNVWKLIPGVDTSLCVCAT